MEEIRVADIMTRSPLVVSYNTSLFKCAKKMLSKKIGSLLLVDKKRLVGIISQRDILWAMIKKSKQNLREVEAIKISPKKIATLSPENTLEEAIKKINKTKFDRFPVVKNKELVGVLTIRDVLNYKPEIFPEIGEFSQIREEKRKLEKIKKAKQKASRNLGICEECGNQDTLYKLNGMMVCEDCREELL